MKPILLVLAGLAVVFCVSASPVSADTISDTFTLMKGGKVVETLTLTEAEEGTRGKTIAFSTLFPLGTGFGAGGVAGDAASFVPTMDMKNLMLQVFSDGDKVGGKDPKDSLTVLIFGKNGKPSAVADTLVIQSEDVPPNVPTPEPGTITLLCAGLVGLGLWAKARATREE